MPKSLIDLQCLLQKFPGKGGWTYANLPGVMPDQHAPFGWVRVKGTIDGFEISKYHLMPTGDGKLFLPVRAEIRKKIKKEAGDLVHVILYPDLDLTETSGDLQSCLQDEPAAQEYFNKLTEPERIDFLKWIDDAKSDTEKVDRIAKTLDMLLQKKPLYWKK